MMHTNNERSGCGVGGGRVRGHVCMLLAAWTIGMVPIGAAAAQDAGERGAPVRDRQGVKEGGREGAGALVDPIAFREMLMRRRAMVEEMRSGLDRAIERVDAGESPAEVRAEMPGAWLSGVWGGGAWGGGEGPGLDRMGLERPGLERPGMERGAEAPGGGPGLTPEEIQRLRAFIDERMPDLAARLAELDGVDARAAGRVIGRLAPRLRETLAMRERSPEMFELRLRELQQSIAITDSARRLRRVIEGFGEESAEATEARDAFRTQAREHFDTQLAIQRLEVEALERRVTELREEIERKTAASDAEIDARLDSFIKSVRPAPEGGPGGVRGRGPRGEGAEGPRRRGPE